MLLHQRVELLARVGHFLPPVLEPALHHPVELLCARLQLVPQRTEGGGGAGDVRIGGLDALHRGAAGGRGERQLLESRAEPLGAGELGAQVLVREAHVEADRDSPLGVELVDEVRDDAAVPGEAAELGDGRLVHRGEHHPVRMADAPALVEAHVEQRVLQPRQDGNLLAAAHFPQVQERKRESGGEPDAESREALEPAHDAMHAGQRTREQVTGDRKLSPPL